MTTILTTKGVVPVSGTKGLFLEAEGNICSLVPLAPTISNMQKASVIIDEKPYSLKTIRKGVPKEHPRYRRECFTIAGALVFEFDLDSVKEIYTEAFPSYDWEDILEVLKELKEEDSLE